MSKEVENAILAAGEYGISNMAMLGNSLFAVGDTDGLVNVFCDHGVVHICRIDKKGMRIVEDEE